jgi:hypothetical protein
MWTVEVGKSGHMNCKVTGRTGDRQGEVMSNEGSTPIVTSVTQITSHDRAFKSVPTPGTICKTRHFLLLLLASRSRTHFCDKTRVKSGAQHSPSETTHFLNGNLAVMQGTGKIPVALLHLLAYGPTKLPQRPLTQPHVNVS